MVAEDQSTPERMVLYYTKALAPGETTPGLSDTIRIDVYKRQDPDGGTPMGDALKKAKSLLDTDNSGNQKYVLFFTDGLPGYYEPDTWYDEYSRRCV